MPAPTGAARLSQAQVVRLKTAAKASELKLWLDIPEHFRSIKEDFNSTSNYARLKSVHTTVAGKLVYIHFKATTGDAMGMNMVSKASPSSLSLPTVLFLCLLCSHNGVASTVCFV